jgi:N-methylhydantoinase A/oxoprolinase/acetone carboxylase beta subunit
MVIGAELLETEVLRGELAPGTRLQGPALCAMPEATLLVAPGWAGEVDAHGTARLRRVEGAP